MALSNNIVVYNIDFKNDQKIKCTKNSCISTNKLKKETYLYQQMYKEIDLDPSDIVTHSYNGLSMQEVIKAIYNYQLNKQI